MFVDINALPPGNVNLFIAVAGVTVLPLVMRILMTPCRATPRTEIAGRCVTLVALCPFTSVTPGVDPEIRGIVVDCVRCPHTRTVTHCAIMRELLRHMVWTVHLLEVRLMTLVAVRVHELVVAIHVTRLALHRGVRPCQREPGGAVIKRRTCPVCR